MKILHQIEDFTPNILNFTPNHKNLHQTRRILLQIWNILNQTWCALEYQPLFKNTNTLFFLKSHP